MRAHILTIETWNISLKRFSLYDYVFQPMFVIEYKSYTIQHNKNKKNQNITFGHAKRIIWCNAFRNMVTISYDTNAYLNESFIMMYISLVKLHYGSW